MGSEEEEGRGEARWGRGAVGSQVKARGFLGLDIGCPEGEGAALYDNGHFSLGDLTKVPGTALSTWRGDSFQWQPPQEVAAEISLYR